MTVEEIQNIIEPISVGTTINIKKSNGDTVSLKLASHDLSGEAGKNYQGVEVPALPAALVVKAKTHVGNTRIPIEEIIKIEAAQ